MLEVSSPVAKLLHPRRSHDLPLLRSTPFQAVGADDPLLLRFQNGAASRATCSPVGSSSSARCKLTATGAVPAAAEPTDNDLINLNVGGMRFTVRRGVLIQHVPVPMPTTVPSRTSSINISPSRAGVGSTKANRVPPAPARKAGSSQFGRASAGAHHRRNPSAGVNGSNLPSPYEEQLVPTMLTAMFSGRWDAGLMMDVEGSAYLDFDPTCFRNLINWLTALHKCRLMAGGGGTLTGYAPGRDEHTASSISRASSLGLPESRPASTNGYVTGCDGYAPPVPTPVWELPIAPPAPPDPALLQPHLDMLAYLGVPLPLPKAPLKPPVTRCLDLKHFSIMVDRPVEVYACEHACLLGPNMVLPNTGPEAAAGPVQARAGATNFDEDGRPIPGQRNTSVHFQLCGPEEVIRGAGGAWVLAPFDLRPPPPPPPPSAAVSPAYGGDASAVTEDDVFPAAQKPVTASRYLVTSLRAGAGMAVGVVLGPRAAERCRKYGVRSPADHGAFYGWDSAASLEDVLPATTASCVPSAGEDLGAVHAARSVPLISNRWLRARINQHMETRQQNGDRPPPAAGQAPGRQHDLVRYAGGGAAAPLSASATSSGAPSMPVLVMGTRVELLQPADALRTSQASSSSSPGAMRRGNSGGDVLSLALDRRLAEVVAADGRTANSPTHRRGEGASAAAPAQAWFDGQHEVVLALDGHTGRLSLYRWSSYQLMSMALPNNCSTGCIALYMRTAGQGCSVGKVAAADMRAVRVSAPE